MRPDAKDDLKSLKDKLDQVYMDGLVKGIQWCIDVLNQKNPNSTLSPVAICNEFRDLLKAKLISKDS